MVRSSDVPMSIQTKIAAALLLVLVTALSTTATLGYFIYDHVLSNLVTSRFEFVARELKRKVEAGLDLGLALGELDNVNALLRQERSTDDALAGLTVRSAKGVVLFDTEPARIGSRPAEAWFEAVTATTAKPSDLYVGQAEVAVPLVNSFGKVVGGLRVAFSQSYYEEKRRATMADLGELTLIALSAAGFLGLCGVLAISRPLEAAVVRLQASIHNLLARMGMSEEYGQSSDLDVEIAALESRVLAAAASLERAEAAAAGGLGSG